MNDTEAIQGSSIISAPRSSTGSIQRRPRRPGSALDYASYYQKPGWLGAVDGTWNNAATGPRRPAGPLRRRLQCPQRPRRGLSNKRPDPPVALPRWRDPSRHTLRSGKNSSSRGQARRRLRHHGGIGMSTAVAADQTFNTDIVGLQTSSSSTTAGVGGQRPPAQRPHLRRRRCPRDIEFTSPSRPIPPRHHRPRPTARPGIRHVHKPATPRSPSRPTASTPANSTSSAVLSSSRHLLPPARPSLRRFIPEIPSLRSLAPPAHLHRPAASSAHTSASTVVSPTASSNPTAPAALLDRNVIFGNGGSRASSAPPIHASRSARRLLPKQRVRRKHLRRQRGDFITNPDGTTTIAPRNSPHQVRLRHLDPHRHELALLHRFSQPRQARHRLRNQRIARSNSTCRRLHRLQRELIFDRDDATTSPHRSPEPAPSASAARRPHASGTHTYSGSTVIEAGTLTGTPSLASA